MDALRLPGTPEGMKGRVQNFACSLRTGGMVLNKINLADQPVHALTRRTPCAYPGGDAIQTSPVLLDALNREQGRLGNLQPGEQFSLARGGKSIKAIFAMAGDQNVCYYDRVDVYTSSRVRPRLPECNYIYSAMQSADRPDAYMCAQRRRTMTTSSKNLALKI